MGDKRIDPWKAASGPSDGRCSKPCGYCWPHTGNFCMAQEERKKQDECDHKWQHDFCGANVSICTECDKVEKG